MANKRKYQTKEEYRQAMQAKRNAYNDRVYKKLAVSLPVDLAERVDARVKARGISKRQFVIDALETALKGE